MDANTAARYIAENPDLIRGDNRVVGAKNIRTMLKRAWPMVRFSVTGKSYSGGDSLNIGWEDGPTEAQVYALVGRFQAGSFDGMTDSYTNSRDPWTDLFGGAMYVFTRRDKSDDLIACAITSIADEFDVADDALPTAADFRAGRLFSRSPYGRDSIHGSWQDRIHQKCAELAA